MLPGRSYLMRIGTKYLPARVTSLKHKVDVNTLEHLAAKTLHLNEVGYCNISLTQPIAFESRVSSSMPEPVHIFGQIDLRVI